MQGRSRPSSPALHRAHGEGVEMRRPFFRRASLTVAAVVVATIASGSPATADTPISQSGSVGERRLIDRPNKPGARCRYEDGAGGGEQVLVRIRVRPPVV